MIRKNRALKHRSVRAALRLAVWAALMPAAARAGDWPQLQANAAHTGWSLDQADPPYQFRWFHFSGHMVNNSVQPVEAGGIVVYGTCAGEVFALEAASGRELWKAECAGPVLNACAICKDAAIAACQDGCVYAFALHDGSELWNFRTGAGLWSAPVAANGLVYIAGKDGCIYALEPQSGGMVWSCDVGFPIVQTPAADENVVVVGAENMTVCAADARTGKLLWKSPRLGGESFQGFWPVLWKGRVLLTATTQYYSRAAEFMINQEVFLAVSKRLALPDPINTPLDERPYLEAMRKYFEQHPHRRTAWVFDAKTGAEPYVPPLMWWGGGGGPMPTAAVNEKDGWAYMLYCNMQAGESGVLFFGRMRLEDSAITPFNEMPGFARRASPKAERLWDGYNCAFPAGYDRDAVDWQEGPKKLKSMYPDWGKKSLFHGGFWVTDQPAAVSCAGDAVYVHHWYGGCEGNWYNSATGDHSYMLREPNDVYGRNILQAGKFVIESLKQVEWRADRLLETNWHNPTRTIGKIFFAPEIAEFGHLQASVERLRRPWAPLQIQGHKYVMPFAFADGLIFFSDINGIFALQHAAPGNGK